jgi:hypothetical protein
MSEHNEEAYGEMAALSRRMARIEISLTERILALEAEVAALRGVQGPEARTIYQDAREIEWREDGAAQDAIDVIMQR